jgi:hypothetical protein
VEELNAQKKRFYSTEMCALPVQSTSPHPGATRPPSLRATPPWRGLETFENRNRQHPTLAIRSLGYRRRTAIPLLREGWLAMPAGVGSELPLRGPLDEHWHLKPATCLYHFANSSTNSTISRTNPSTNFWPFSRVAISGQPMPPCSEISLNSSTK